MTDEVATASGNPLHQPPTDLVVSKHCTSTPSGQLDVLETFLQEAGCRYLAERLRQAGIANAQALDTLSKLQTDYRQRIKAELDKKGPEIPILDWVVLEAALDKRAAAL